MNKKVFFYNNFRTKRFGSRILAVSEQGGWADFSKKEFDSLIRGNTTKKIMDSGLAIDKKNINGVIEKQRQRYCHLFNGTSLHIVVPTLRCNLSCSYCHSKAKSEKAKNYDMDKKTAKKAVDFIFQSLSAHIKIEFQGGEPLLNFGIIKEIIEYAKKVNKNKDLKFALVTNLTKIDDKKLKYLIKNKVGICTSLDGPKHLHDKIRVDHNQGGSYKNVVSWIETIKDEYKYPIDALMVTTRHSLQCPREIVDEYIKHGFNRIQFKSMNNLGNAQKAWGSLSYSAEEYLTFWKQAIEYMVELNLKGEDIYDAYTTYILKKILTNDPNIFVDLQSPCGAAISQLAYDYNGDIFTCDEGRQYDLFKLGNVRNNDYREILTSNETASIISASTNDCFLCDACVYKPYCGLCPVCCYAETGSVVPKLSMDNRCKILKGIFDYIFEKLIFSDKHKKVFTKWANIKSD
ncbi:MAG: His-Xaa-Ser system radical SAM maturase HxsB [Nanoarchaeota archaeon]